MKPARLLACLLGCILAVPASAAAGFRDEWTVESSDARGVILLWENAGRDSASAAAVRTAALGLPAGSRPAGTVEVLAAAGSAPVSRALPVAGKGLSLSQPARYRDLDVATVSFDPGAGGRLASRARIRVDFRPAGIGSYRTAFAPPPESAPERHLSGWLLNYPQSRGFRGQAPAPAMKASASAREDDGPGRSAALPKVRLVIKTRGDNIVVLDHAALKRAGVPLESIDPRMMRLWHDGLEVPMHIAGGDDGRWHPQDYIEFIGKEPRGGKTRLSLYVSTSTFLLTWEGGRLGLRAPVVPVPSRARGLLAEAADGVREAPPYRAAVHMEVDQEILRIGSTAAEEVVDLGASVREAELTDFWMWKRQGPDKDATEIPFTLDHAPVALGQGASLKSVPLRIRVNLKGITDNPKADPDHHVKFILNGKDISLVGGVANDAIWEGQESYTWVSRDLDPGLLEPGENILVLQKVNDLKANDGSVVEVQDAFLNWFDLEFPSGYEARNDHLRFSNDFEDSLGVRRFVLGGFTREDLSVWDLRGRKLTGYAMSRQGDRWSLTMVDSLAGPSQYVACALEKRERPEVALDTLPDLVNPAEGADWLVITHKELLGSALDSLVEHRRKQGLRVKVVMATHIYQAFGDGSLDPSAIRRFTGHAYRAWPRPAPAYLLLLGEASLWYEKLGGEFQRTLVPTALVNIHGWGVAANDDYYAKVSGDDDIADLFVGRIPVASRGDLGRVVRKTLALENRRPSGHWSNKALLISGFEETFTLQNARLQSLMVGHDRQYSRLDLYPESPHYRNPSRMTDFFDQVDSSFSLVSFVGHGGGAVWSDAGVLTLRHLDEGRLKGEYPIPFVSSVTCLTGYFEDVGQRSLGEEMVRLEQGGSASFYGAAGYISNLAGEALSYEVLRAAARGGATAGAVVHQAETMVQLKTAGAFGPILSEFNLLGDPALRLTFPESEGELDLSPRTLAGAKTLVVNGKGLDPAAADGVLTLFLGDSSLGASPVAISGGAFSADRDLSGLSGPVPDGKAVLNYWSGRQSRVASAPFTTLDWIIDSVRTEPSTASPGDSVTLVLRLGTAYGRTSVAGGVAVYAVGGDAAPLFPPDNQVALKMDDAGRLVTAARIQVPMPTSDLAHPSLYVAFRISVRILDEDGNATGAIPNLSSRTYALPLSDLARLSFAEPAFRIPIQDSLGVWTVFRNGGLGKATGFKVRLTQDAGNAIPVEATLDYGGDLALGGTDSLFFPLPDSMLAGKRLRAALIASREGELSDRGTLEDSVFQVFTRQMSLGTDTLVLDSATRIAHSSGGKSHRVFAEKATLAALPSHLAPAADSLPAEAWRIRSAGLEAGKAVLIRSYPPPAAAKSTAASAPSAALPASDATRPFWHWQAAGSQAWVRLDSASAGFPWTGMAWRDGLYAPLLNRDATAPLIQFSSRGQSLLQDDYVPQGTPINVVVRDAEGVDMEMRVPELASARQMNDSSTLAVETSSSFPTLVRFNFIPRHGSATDSLTVTAADVSGNVAVKTLAYRIGTDLSIGNLGSYPNPFADTAVFVYSLTDYCEKVQLKVYSRAGRLVRTLEERNVVGYREVVWDGKSGSGANIGNGLYFLKVTARSGDQESSKVFKLFKKRRK